MAKKKKYEKVTSITTADEYGNTKTVKLSGDTGGYHYNPKTGESTPALSAVGRNDTRTIKTNQINNQKNNTDIRTIKTEDTNKQDDVKTAIKKYGDTIKNSQVKKNGFSLSNAITDIANIYDAKKNIAKSIPGIGKVYGAADKALSTAENVATNMGTGALKSVESAADMASDLVFNPMERRYTYAFDLLTKGKKTADENLKDLKKMQQRDIKKSQTEAFQKATGYSDVVDDIEKNSLVTRENAGGQFAQMTGGMVPQLVLGQALGGTTPLKDLKGLKGKELAKGLAKNSAINFKNQLPANLMLAGQSYGGGLEDALNKGNTIGQSRLYGGTNIVNEVLPELMFGGVPGLGGKGGIDNLVEPILDKGYKGYSKPLVKGLYKAVGEGLEEKATTYLDALARQGILGENINWKDVKSDSDRDFIYGMLMGGFLNSPESIQGIQEVRGSKTNGNNLNTINNNVPSTQQVREVNEIQQRAENGEISYEQANQQLAQVQDGTYQQNQLIDSMASQEVEKIQREVETGQMSPVEASQEIQAVNNTLTSERERINQPVQEVKEANIDETTQEKPVEKASNEQETTQEPIKVEARETKSSENKAEKVTTEVIKSTHNNENGRSYKGAFYKDNAYGKLSDKEIKTAGDLREKIKNKQKLTTKENQTLEVLNRKRQGLKNPELKTNNTFEEVKRDLARTKLDNYDDKLMREAKEINKANKQGRRTKQQWLDTAKFMGMQMQDADSKAIKDYALQTFISERPNTKDNLNRQGKKFVDFKANEWVNAFYEGARVGEKIETKEETPKAQEKVKKEEQPKVETSKENIAEKVEEPVIKIKEKLPEKNNKFEEIKFEQNEKIEPNKVDVLGEVPSKKKQSITEKAKSYTKEVKETGSFLRRKFVDKMQSIDMLDRANNRKDNLYAEADRTHRSVAEAQYSIGDGQINSEGKEYNNFTNKDGSKGNKSLLGIFDEVEENGMDMQEFNEYLIDYLNLDRYDKVTEDGKTKAPRGLDHTKKMSEENIKKFEEKHSEAKRIAENIWQYGYNELDTKVQDGLMTKQQAQNFMKETPHYVPLSRDVEGYQSALQKVDNRLSVNNQIKKIKGDSRETILPIRETMAWNTVLSRSSQRTNNAIKAIAPYYDAANTDLSYSDSDLNINQDNVAVKSKDGKYYLTYYENGQAKTMQVEKGMYEAFLPEQIYEWEKIFKIPAGIDSLRKKLITDYNIKFLKNNAIKDLQDAMINTQYPKEFLQKYADVATRLKNKDADSKMQQYINEFKKAGGFSETYFADREFTSQETKNPVKKSLQALNKANEYIELTPRLTEYILSRENGESVSVALHNAADVTVNFSRGGTWAKKMNKLGFTFFNPSIQGADKAIRNLDPRNPRRFASTVVRGALLGISAGVLNELLWDIGDDDDKKEYDNLNEYIKNNYYILPDKNGKPSVRIPKGRMMSVLQSIGRRGYNTYKGEDSFVENFKDLPSYAWGQVGPADPGNNNVFAPLFQAWSNKSWSGNPIDSTYEVNNTAPEERYSVKTTEMAKKLGKALGISPKRIDYVFDQYSGSIGDLIIPMTNKYAETSSDSKILEGLGAVFGNDMKVDPVFSNKQLGKMYDNSNKYNNLTTKEKEKMKNKIGNQYLNEKIGEISEINKQIKEIQGSNKSNKEKQKETRKLQKQINDIAENANNTYKKVKKQGDYAATVGENVYSKTDYGQWKKESEQTKAKRDSLGLNVEDYYYLKKEEAFTQPNGRKQSLVDGETAKQKIALVDAFGFDPSDYLEYSYNINNIKEGKNTKQKVFEYINSLDISQEQKIALMKKKYKTYRSYDNQLYNTINNADLTKEEKESVANFLKIGG